VQRQRVYCDVTKTVTLRSGDMIRRYEVRSWRKKERQRIRPVCSRNTTSSIRKSMLSSVPHIVPARGEAIEVPYRHTYVGVRLQPGAAFVVVRLAVTPNSTAFSTMALVPLFLGLPPSSPRTHPPTTAFCDGSYISVSFSLSCLLGAYTDIPLEGFLHAGLSFVSVLFVFMFPF
jgi:hypothetical protein